MMQGDCYRLPIEIKTATGPANADSFRDVEVTIGTLRKTMSDGQITYDPEKKVFLIPITQEESFTFLRGTKMMQVRVKLENGDVIGTKLPNINIIESLSREVL